MAISSGHKPSSEKLFVILILFAGLAIAYLLASNAEIPSVGQPIVAMREEIPLELRTINLDLSVLDNILFTQLKVFGIIPVSPGQTGRADPFAPF